MSSRPFLDYHRTVRWLDSLSDLVQHDHRDYPAGKGRPFVIGLRRMENLLDSMGLSFDGLEVVHVGGTSGKGSVCAMLASIFREAPKAGPTGAFFSPHVTTLLERIWMDGRMLQASRLVELVQTLKPILLQAHREGPFGIPSYFEATLGLALLCFYEEGCRRAILEVGLGGRLDATNVFPRSAITVITNIGLDHTDILGKTEKEVAKEKAGIIKPGGLILTGVKEGPARKVIEATCASRGARLLSLSEGVVLEETTASGTRFHLEACGLEPMRGLELKMGGAHQVQNGALAAAAAQLLGLPASAIRRGLLEARLPGRMECVQETPRVILDGAHNLDKASALREALDLFSPRRRYLVLGVLGDKDVEGIAKVLAPGSAGVFVTHPTSPPRPSCPPERLAQLCAKFAPVAGVFLDPFDALDAALNEARQEDLVCVTGSLFLVGELREHWHPLEEILAARSLYPHGA
jgi:dihydrofolate synthase/folylpolyglutamate synthase